MSMLVTWLLPTAVLYLCASHASGQMSTCSNTNPCRQFRVNDVFVEPNFYQSRARRLDVILNVDISEVTYDWLKLKRRTYNGKIGGPTWMVYPGDTVHLTLNNRLGPNPAQDNGPNTFRKPNTTNIHVHGLHISPEGNADNIFLTTEPGATQRYQFNIPTNHPAGTYWYHPHVHGSGNFQLASGMAGLIIIQDNPYDPDVPYALSSVSCPLNCHHDIQMLVQPTLQYDANAVPSIYGDVQSEIQDDPLFRNEQYLIPGGGNLATWLSNRTNGVNYYTVNGKLQPRIFARAGQMKRFRFANAGGAHSLELEVTSAAGGASRCEWREIALDGVYLDAPRLARTGQSLVLPGGRVDWLLRCDQPGTYQIISNRKASNNLSMGRFNRFNGVLATIQVFGIRMAYPMDFPFTLPPRPDILQDLRFVGDREMDKYVVEMTPFEGLNRETFPESTAGQIRYKMQLGKLQEWTFINPHPVLMHPMHVHVNHFQVISYNKYNGPVIISDSNVNNPFGPPTAPPTNPNITVERIVDQNGDHCEYQYTGFTLGDAPSPKKVNLSSTLLGSLGHDRRYYTGPGNLAYAEIGEYRDTISVPPLSNVTIRFVPLDFTGRVFVHCHNTVHSDQGMALVTEVVPEGSSTAGMRVPSNNVYPGTCHPGDFYPGVPNLPPPATTVGTPTTQTVTTTTPTTTSAPTTVMQMPINFLDFVRWLLATYPTNLADYLRNPFFYLNEYRQTLVD